MTEFFDKNIDIAKNRYPALCERLLSSQIQGKSKIIKFSDIISAKNGANIISVTANNGLKINLSSHYNPQSEAETICDKIMQKTEDGIIILLGAGSGYILKSLSERDIGKREIVWIEYDKIILRHILSLHNLSEILKNYKFHIVLSNDPSEAIKKIISIRIKSGFKDIEVVPNPAEKKINEIFTTHIEKALYRIKLSPIKKLIDYRKFSADKQRIIVFDSSYFTVRECIRAFRMLGHNVSTFNFERKKDFIPELISLILDFKPDFVFTVNHLGFDEEGRLSSLLSSMNIPFAVWYVDNPLYALKESNANVSEFCKLFMWEKNYIVPMKQRGFHQITYLPLAADTHIFNPLPASENHRKFASDISFVGNSMFEAVKKWKKKLKARAPLQNIEEEIINTQMSNHCIPMGKIIKDKIRSNLTTLTPDTLLFIDTTAYLTWKATMRYRHKVVTEGIATEGIVYGDDGWKKVIKNSQVRKNIDYYRELSSVYKFTKINLNCTSFQMNSALNQRVFDCAACNAFLITDNQPELFELFNKDEFVCFNSPEEIQELTAYYLKHKAERRKITLKAFNRVTKNHTYEIRMSKLIAEMKKDFGGKLNFQYNNGGLNNVCTTNQ